MKTQSFALILLLLLTNATQADVACFRQAENYYEQLYCELKAKGKGRELPPWRDFRNNDEMTQALLLKRPASRVGITVKLPHKSTPHRSPPKQATAPVSQAPVSQAPVSQAPVTHAAAAPATVRPRPANDVVIYKSEGRQVTGCHKNARNISCGDNVFTFAANRRNSALAPGVLSDSYKMGLPAFRGNSRNTAAVEKYLAHSFAIYLDKMISIGLAEFTMSYSAFASIFYDLDEKGVSFSNRFETMFRYLKKDKATMHVPISTASGAFSLQGCQFVGNALISCQQADKHYLFVRDSDQG